MTVKLTDYEKSILAGDFGDEARKILEVMIKVYEINDAKDFVDVKEAMLASTQNMTLSGTLGVGFLNRLAASGIRFKVKTVVDPVSIDLEAWQRLGIPEDFAVNQMKSVNALIKLGVVPMWTCVPYLTGSIHRYGDHVSYVETSVVCFVNSYFGARTNREMDLTAMAAAITGRTPCYGMHLADNREGGLLVHVNVELVSTSDYDALGNTIGKIAKTRIPVFKNVPRDVSVQALMQLSAAIATTGAVPLFHVFDVTPEIIYDPHKYGEKNILEEITITKNDMEKAYQELNTTQSREIDFVSIGCPHYTIDKLREIAAFLEGKKIKKGVEVWICTSRANRNLARESGEVQVIESTGAKVVIDTCMVLAPIKQMGFRTMATDSAKAQFYVSGAGLGVRFGDTRKCLQAALIGKWEE
jgi:predicted aconitase